MNQRMTSRATPALRERHSSSSGFSLAELLIVLIMISIVSAIALPKLVGSSRLIASTGIPREIVTYLRFARQEAITRNVVFTCRYDNQAKTITIINHGERGITYDPTTDAMVRLPGNTAVSADEVADVTVEQIPLARARVPANDIAYGRVDGNPATTALDDGATMVTLPTSKLINITFQPDGSVVNAQNAPLNRSLFLYNQQIQQQSAFAISVLGTTGRIKLWRYNSSANTYAE
jgi:prepilin-type N-terminal cleavage/methylation domain-containing protein